jgi:mRNA-degrading endonuclease RelE of RelBE toxin-antitoxin system
MSVLVQYAPSFLRALKTLPPDLQEEVVEKVSFLMDRKHHRMLKVHALKGKLRGRFSFSVNYRTRIVFQWQKTNSVVLLAIGDHDVYR